MGTTRVTKGRPLLLPAVLISGALLLATVARLPYGYYQFLRWVTCAGAILFAVRGPAMGQPWAPWVFALLAFLFNPLAPIHVPRESWRLFDIAWAVIFLAGGILLIHPDVQLRPEGGK